MLTQERIDQQQKAILAAYRFARRRREGAHEDRWCEGTDGAHLVALGIEAQAERIEYLLGTVSDLLADQFNAGMESMGLGPVPEKYATKE